LLFVVCTTIVHSFNCPNYKSIGTAFKTTLYGLFTFGTIENIENVIPYKSYQDLPAAKSGAGSLAALPSSKALFGLLMSLTWIMMMMG
jgi:hypothetical protein